MAHMENMDSYVCSHFNTEAQCFVSHHDLDIQYRHTVGSPVCTLDFLIGFSECKLAWKNVLNEPLNNLRSALASRRHNIFRIFLSLLSNITMAITGLVNTADVPKQHCNSLSTINKRLLIEHDDVRINNLLSVDVSNYANVWSSVDDSDDDDSFHSMSDCDETSSQDDTDSECFMDRYDSTSEASEAGFLYDNVQEENGPKCDSKCSTSSGDSLINSLFVDSGPWLPLSHRRCVSAGDLNKLYQMNAIREQLSSTKTCLCYTMSGKKQSPKIGNCDSLPTCLTGKVQEETKSQTERYSITENDSQDICIEADAVETIEQQQNESSNTMIEDMNIDSAQSVQDNEIEMLHDVNYQDFPGEKTVFDCIDNESSSNEHVLPSQVKIFPPPLSIRASETHPEFPGCVSRTFWKSVKKDGRFVLQEVQAQPQECFLARRDNGRLLLQLVKAD